LLLVRRETKREKSESSVTVGKCTIVWLLLVWTRVVVCREPSVSEIDYDGV